MNRMYQSGDKEDWLVIGGLAFFGHCGITPEERITGQRFTLDLEMACDVRKAAEADDLKAAFDYAAVSKRMIEIGRDEQFNLIETMAERLARAVLSEFGVGKVRIRLRKQAPPIEPIMEFAAVDIEREGDA